MKITTVGIDLAKNVFQVHGVDERGRAVLRKQLRRDQMAGFFANLPPCLIGMEACGSAHHWARKLQKFGHTRAADGAAVRQALREDQQERRRRRRGDLRSGGSTEHALRADQERRAAGGAVAASGATGLREGSHGARQPDPWLAGRVRADHPARASSTWPSGCLRCSRMQATSCLASFRQLIAALDRALKELDRQVDELEAQIKAWHRGSELSRKLEKIPGIGPLAASALVASIGDANSFDNGRQLSAWLGLVPRQHSSGGKPKLLGISKRGDVYLRTLLIHGARSAILAAQRKAVNTNVWLRQPAQPASSERCGRRAGQQERAHGLGAACPRPRVPSRLRARGLGRVAGSADRQDKFTQEITPPIAQAITQ